MLFPPGLTCVVARSQTNTSELLAPSLRLTAAEDETDGAPDTSRATQSIDPNNLLSAVQVSPPPPSET